MGSNPQPVFRCVAELILGLALPEPSNRADISALRVAHLRGVGGFGRYTVLYVACPGAFSASADGHIMKRWGMTSPNPRAQNLFPQLAHGPGSDYNNVLGKTPHIPQA